MCNWAVTWENQNESSAARAADVQDGLGSLVAEPAMATNAWANLTITYSHERSARELPTTARTAPSSPGNMTSIHDQWS